MTSFLYIETPQIQKGMFSYVLDEDKIVVIKGRVLDDQGGPMPGANVVVVEKETGTQYGTITDDKGYYHIPNMNPGGPYTLTISYVGFATYEEARSFLQTGPKEKKKDGRRSFRTNRSSSTMLVVNHPMQKIWV